MQRQDFTEEQEEVLQSIRASRIIFPIIIGIAVVGYLFWNQFNPEEFAKINWNRHVLSWVSLALIFLVIRHLAYSLRLRILSQGEFSWLKCIELIFIWEFSSAVSPTALGGSAVALFVLSQEKLKTAKVTAIVLYTVVLDTAFFISTLFLLVLWIGPNMIRPGMTGWQDIDYWGYLFIASYIFMFLYGVIFYYGLFVQPRHLKKLLLWVTSIRWLNRYRVGASELADDFILASRELKARRWPFHLGAFLATFGAWTSKFILINFLIIAFNEGMQLQVNSQLELYARLEAMFVIMAFSPTPGGAGFAEYVFGGFLRDYVPKGISLIVAISWRILTYYSYLLAGVIIIPNWIRKIVVRRQKARRKKAKGSAKNKFPI